MRYGFTTDNIDMSVSFPDTLRILYVSQIVRSGIIASDVANSSSVLTIWYSKNVAEDPASDDFMNALEDKDHVIEVELGGMLEEHKKE